jgi:hypothetical protein
MEKGKWEICGEESREGDGDKGKKHEKKREGKKLIGKEGVEEGWEKGIMKEIGGNEEGMGRNSGKPGRKVREICGNRDGGGGKGTGTEEKEKRARTKRRTVHVLRLYL